MSNNKIAINAAATYIRTILVAALALFSSRWVLLALGQTDFGLFSVVGSVILFVTFLNTVMSGSVARYFAYSIGQGDGTEVNRWFNAALGIHLCLALSLLLAGWVGGNYVVSDALTIPHDRLAACMAVFRISLVSAFISMVAVPFIAMFAAKQRIAELAFWGIVQAILTFMLAVVLGHLPGDRLTCYAVGMVAIVVVVQSAQILRAVMTFSECSISCGALFDLRRTREMFSFATWNLIGSSGVLCRDQGSAILLNMFFGPTVNAAYGIALQVSNQTNQLSAAMISAFSPEITACEGRGDRVRMLSLSQRASKFGAILVLLVAIPLITEMEYVLQMWLRTPPPHSALFCQLILGTFIIDRLTTGNMLAINARGKIAGYQLTLGTTLLLTLPLAWVLLKLGLPPTTIGFAFIATMTITSLGRVLWGRHLLGLSIRGWMISVAYPTVLVGLAGTVAALGTQWLLPPSFLRLLSVTSASVAATVCTTWFLGLNAPERDFCRQSASRCLSRLSAFVVSCRSQHAERDIP